MLWSVRLPKFSAEEALELLEGQVELALVDEFLCNPSLTEISISKFYRSTFSNLLIYILLLKDPDSESNTFLSRVSSAY